jgi:Raf kinase inhibitor-like YbhB/YbcL family protein
MAFKLRSPAFGPGGEIPLKYTGDGTDVSPPLRWTDPPEGTKSFALTVDDREDPPNRIWIHWVLYGMAATVRDLPEGVPRQDTVAGVGTQGVNDFGEVGYSGPRPPSGPAHLYFFRLYAVDTALALPPRRLKAEFLKALAGHSLARVDLIGRYKRQ